MMRRFGLRSVAATLVCCALLGAAACNTSDKGGATNTTLDVVTTQPAAGGDLFAINDNKGLDPKVQPRADAPAGGEATSVSFTADDGQRIPSIVIMPTAAPAPHPCVIVQHGLDSRKEDGTPFFAPLINAKAGVIAIDARVHGERGTQAQRYAAFDDPVKLRAFMIDTIKDLRRTLDYLSTRPECDAKRVGYLGFSMGAILGSILAGVDSRVHGAALISGGGDWRVLLGQSSNPFLSPYKNPARLDAAVKVLDPVDPVKWVGKAAGRALYFANGELDPVVVPAAGRAYQAAANQPKQITWYQGAHAPEGLELARVFGDLVNWYAQNFAGN